MSDPGSSKSAAPAIQVVVEAGVPVMRDGWVAVFYLPAPRARHAAAVRDTIERCLALLAPRTLRWTTDEDGDSVEMGDAEIDAALERIETAGERSATLLLMDEPSGVSAHRLRYVGIGSDAPNLDAFPDAVSVLFMSFATETVAALGSDLLVRFCDRTAAALDVGFAYCSPAFLYAPGAGETPAFTTIRQLCRRFRCLDVPYISADMLELGPRARGAYWSTWLGAAATARLGGRDALARRLSARPEVRVAALDGGLTSIRAGDQPQAGDVNRQEDFGAYRAIAAALRPIAYRPTFPFPEFSEEETQAWFDRFDDAP